MDSIFIARGSSDAIPIWFVTAANYSDVRKMIGAEGCAFADAAGFEPKPGRHLLLPGKNGNRLGGVLFGLECADDPKDPFLPGRLPSQLPDGVYRFANEPNDARLAALAFALGSYAFTRYRKAPPRSVKLDVPQSVDRAELQHIVEGVTLARDLINTPANDMGPAQLEQAARKLAARHAATVSSIVGDELLEHNFPLIHAVGRAAAGAPRLIDISWGEADHPRVTLVGKGVCFDTGGLDIKPDASMLNMKKDMGGAATALALAHMIMARGLKVRLRVLIPAVENAIAGTSFRPRDIYTSRRGITVEIGNTDAEGRLILADALALADEDKPALIADFATLTGAARVALGPDVPAFFTDDDGLADELMHAAAAENDPMWRLPLWRPYESMLESKVADINNVGGGQGGAITAALFMRRFVDAPSWLHFDLFAWTPSAKAGRPEGGECQVARALYALLTARYG
jgi:leucyl aminopeptidase